MLLMSDPVDEWVVQALDEYDGKPLKSAEKGDIDLPQVDAEKQNTYAPLFGFIKSKLQDKSQRRQALHPSQGFLGLSVR